MNALEFQATEEFSGALLEFMAEQGMTAEEPLDKNETTITFTNGTIQVTVTIEEAQ